MKTFQIVHFDGGNGACLGKRVEGEVVGGELHIGEEVFQSRNEDGLFSDEEEGTLFVPV